MQGPHLFHTGPQNLQESREPVLAHGSQFSSSGKWVSLAGVVGTKTTCKIPIVASSVSVCLAPHTVGVGQLPPSGLVLRGCPPRTSEASGHRHSE